MLTDYRGFPILKGVEAIWDRWLCCSLPAVQLAVQPVTQHVAHKKLLPLHRQSQADTRYLFNIAFFRMYIFVLLHVCAPHENYLLSLFFYRTEAG